MRHVLGSTVGTIGLFGLLVMTNGCGGGLQPSAEAQDQRGQNGPPAVDVAVADTGVLQTPREYTGTTRPNQDVTLRAQVEGRVLSLAVDVGDVVSVGDVVAEVDDNILQTDVLQAEAELAARESEVARLRTQASDARTQVERTRLELRQAQSDANRLQQLYSDGAIAAQQAETAETTARTSEQILQSAQQQVQSQEAAIAAAERRVAAQQAAVDQTIARQNWAVVQAPVNGAVLERLTEEGNLVRPGDAVLRLGDFSQVKVSVQVSDLGIATIRVGQSVQVRLDAFPDRTLRGRVSRVSPAANPAVRLIPVEVIIPNPSGTIGSGLLARVQFAPQTEQRVIVPESALVKPSRDRPAAPGSSPQAKTPSKPPAAGAPSPAGRSNDRPQGNAAAQPPNRPGQNPDQPQPATLFVVTGEGAEATVVARQVMVGKRTAGQVEILSGLKPGERYVAKSSRPLKDGEAVRMSILSEQG